MAPNMANMCCRPSTNILGAPRVRASRMGACPMVVSFSFIFSSPLPRENRKKNTGTSADTIGMTLQTLGLVQLPPT